MKKLLISAIFTISSICNAQGSYSLYNYELDRHQISYNTEETRSIASITKLFTAITIIRAGLELNEFIKIQGKSRGKFPKGALVSRRDVLKAMLISSDNLAAETLANTYPGGFNKYLAGVNEYVQGIGLTHTSIVDASGLLAGNTSSIDDLIKFLGKIQANSLIREITHERQVTIALPKGKKVVKINLHNTNPSIFTYDNILISKTGFTSQAGRCVIMLVEKAGLPYAVVILGQKNVKERSKIASELILADPKLQ